jgi:hypothetical protein
MMTNDEVLASVLIQLRAERETSQRNFDYAAGFRNELVVARADRTRLAEALKVCEEALHHRSVIHSPLTGAAEDVLLAAQQASGAYCTDWQPGGEDRDDEVVVAP